MRRTICIATLLLWLCGVAPGAGKQPVFIYLYSRISDHVNLDLTGERLRRTLETLERTRSSHSQQGPQATILLSGAVSQAIAETDSSKGLKRLIEDYARRGVVQLGYDGSDEPTYVRRPLPDFTNAKTPEQRWLARGSAAEKFLTEARDPLTGVPVPGVSGGLKKMQEVFGEAVCVTGITTELGGDSEYVHHLGRYNPKAIMFGVPDPDPARNIHGYRGSAISFGQAVSPTPDTSPELYWEDHVLRSSETSSADIRVVSAHEGPEAMKTLLDKLDRSHVRIIHVEVSDVRMYLDPNYREGFLYPPTRLAYDHPDQPYLPKGARLPEKDVTEAYARQDALLKWLAEEFLPANPGSRFVSSTDLKELTSPSLGADIPVDALTKATSELLKTWGTDLNPPTYLEVAGRYLSLADSFAILVNVLSERNSGRSPKSVRLAKVYGPLEVPSDHGPALGAVPVSSITRVCSKIVDKLNDQTWHPVPNNVVPAWLEVEGIRVNAAQFLRLMLEALVASTPETKLNVKMTNMLTYPGIMYPKTRVPQDQGGTWTYKPAPLRLTLGEQPKS